MAGPTQPDGGAIRRLISSPGWRGTGRTSPGANIPSGAWASSSRQDGASRSGSRFMDRQGITLFWHSLRFLLIAAGAPVAAAAPTLAAEPTAASPATLADGTWTVQGRAIPGHRRCGNWLVRLTN